jgi:Flp pilus assembly pilin Flp
VKSIRRIARFLSDDLGQSLTEHTLLLAFVTMLALSIFIAAGGHTADIWSMGSSQLATANQSVTAATASSPPSGEGGDRDSNHHHHH